MPNLKGPKGLLTLLVRKRRRQMPCNNPLKLTKVKTPLCRYQIFNLFFDATGRLSWDISVLFLLLVASGAQTNARLHCRPLGLGQPPDLLPPLWQRRHQFDWLEVFLTVDNDGDFEKSTNTRQPECTLWLQGYGILPLAEYVLTRPGQLALPLRLQCRRNHRLRSSRYFFQLQLCVYGTSSVR